MNKLIAIGQASKLLGVSIQTLRNESLKNINKNIKFNIDNLKTIAYARVSSHDQKDDLIRQVQVLEHYCAKSGFNYEIIQDLGSGMNYYKKGLTKLLNLILEGQEKTSYNTQR